MLSHAPNVVPDLNRTSSAASSSKSTTCKLASSSSSSTHNRMLSLEHDPSYMSNLKTLHAKIGAESAKQRRSLHSTTPTAGASPRLGGHSTLPGSPYATSTFYDSEDDNPDTSSDIEQEELSPANSTRRCSFVVAQSPTFATAPSTPRTPRPCSRDSSRRRSLLVPEAPRSPARSRSSFSGTTRREDWQSSFTGLVDVQRAATATRASSDSTSATATAAAATTHSSSGAVTPVYSTSTSTPSRAASPIAEQAIASVHPSASPPIKSTFIKTRRTFSSVPSLAAHASQSRSRRAESAPPPRPEALAIAAVAVTDGSETRARTYTSSAQPNLSTILSVAPPNEQAEQRRYLTAAPPTFASRSKATEHDEQGVEDLVNAQVDAVQKNFALRTKLQAWTLGLHFSALRARRKWNAATGHHE